MSLQDDGCSGATIHHSTRGLDGEHRPQRCLYLNIRIHSSQYKFQRYVFLETVWEIVTLPFGNAQAPYAFTRFVKALLKRWRARLGIRCLAWLDDIIAAHQCPRHLAWALQQMLDDLSYAGLKVNPKVGKSTLYPTQDLVWVGVRWLTLLAAIRIPPSRLHSVRKEVGAMIQLARRGTLQTHSTGPAAIKEIN